MSTKTPKSDAPAKDSREERLAQALRDNLKRRKAQARGRKADIKSPDSQKIEPGGEST